MLVRFSLENYKSIHKKVTLSFIAETLKQHEDSNLITTEFQKLSLLKALALYGANASGKTNLIKGLSFMRDFVLGSSVESQPNKLIDVDPYRLLLKTRAEPSQFEIDIIVNENRYRYGFIATKTKVKKEYLYLILKTTEKLLFERNGDEIEFGVSFSEGFGKEGYVKQNSLLLSTLGQLNGAISSQLIEWFSNLTIITDYNYPSFTGYTAQLLKDHKSSEFLLKVFRAAGLEFEDVDVRSVNIDDNLTQFLSIQLRELVRKNLPQQFNVITSHKVFDLDDNVIDNVEFGLKEESAGTQKFFAIAGPIINSLFKGYPILIDELDARLHFKLVYFLVSLYCSKKFNPYGGQLVFSNHMIDLMDRELLRRDQIILMTNTKTGTKLSNIHQKGARSDRSYKKDYLNKEYGAIPDVALNQLDLFDDFF